jgi:hypothetical protein
MRTLPPKVSLTCDAEFIYTKCFAIRNSQSLRRVVGYAYMCEEWTALKAHIEHEPASWAGLRAMIWPDQLLSFAVEDSLSRTSITLSRDVGASSKINIKIGSPSSAEIPSHLGEMRVTGAGTPK